MKLPPHIEKERERLADKHSCPGMGPARKSFLDGQRTDSYKEGFGAAWELVKKENEALRAGLEDCKRFYECVYETSYASDALAVADKIAKALESK